MRKRICECASHLMPVLHPDYRQQTIERCVADLREHADKFDAIAMCGYSMALIAPTVADRLGKDLIVVRKKGEQRSSWCNVEGAFAERYIIIDDLVCSQTTLNHVKSWISKYHYNGSKLYGIYLYNLKESAYRNHGSVAYYLKTLLLNKEGLKDA